MERRDVQEQTVAAFEIFSPRWSADGAYEKETRGVEKKLRLFGFEVDPYTNNGRCLKGSEERDESVNSSNSILFRREKPAKEKSSLVDDKKYECQFCLKEFGNSQALGLGGHQNAHKKERLKKKRLQLQARKASINHYLQPFQGPHGFGFYGSPAFYDHSSYVPEFTTLGESQISFNHYDQNAFMNGYLNGPFVLKSYPVPLHVPVQQDNLEAGPRKQNQCTTSETTDNTFTEFRNRYLSLMQYFGFIPSDHGSCASPSGSANKLSAVMLMPLASGEAEGWRVCTSVGTGHS